MSGQQLHWILIGAQTLLWIVCVRDPGCALLMKIMISMAHPGPWKNYLPRNWSLVLKRLGTVAIQDAEVMSMRATDWVGDKGPFSQHLCGSNSAASTFSGNEEKVGSFKGVQKHLPPSRCAWIPFRPHFQWWDWVKIFLVEVRVVKRLWGRACGDVHKCQGVSPLPLLSLIKCQRERECQCLIYLRN